MVILYTSYDIIQYSLLNLCLIITRKILSWFATAKKKERYLRKPTSGRCQ